ncbi:ATG8-interacting protein 1-like [Phragmites australis]|uniref:ATG8-interacting protein 1-like n=1 Tax=Phragmites australis TaxID=29695 RepID=UPI002D7894DF|nr:ATG8-interacting protein 1-like [Phragmites australis]
MASDNKVTEVSSVADEWDMLSLTSSVYASPLYRKGFDPINLPGYGDVSNSQQGTHPGLYVSDGFVFPPSEHENLPIEPEVDELNTNNNGKECSCDGNNDEWCYVEPDEVDGINDENPSVSSDLPSANETTFADSKPPEIHAKEEKDRTTFKSDLPSEGWWKRKSTYLFHHIKGLTTVCSVVAAGAVVGFVVMGKRWQQDNWHLHQLHFSISSESTNQVIGLFSRLKDGLPGSQQLRSLLPTRVLPQQQLSA